MECTQHTLRGLNLTLYIGRGYCAGQCVYGVVFQQDPHEFHDEEVSLVFITAGHNQQHTSIASYIGV